MWKIPHTLNSRPRMSAICPTESPSFSARRLPSIAVRGGSPGCKACPASIVKVLSAWYCSGSTPRSISISSTEVPVVSWISGMACEMPSARNCSATSAGMRLPYSSPSVLLSCTIRWASGTLAYSRASVSR